MRYYMFIDESGEANITNPDPRFNIFVLCGVIFREDCYHTFNQRFKDIKNNIFGKEDIVFHSVEMRPKKGVFKIFLDKGILDNFYLEIDDILKNCDYHIISCVVNKEKYKMVYPEKNHAYEDALTFICERGIHLMGSKNRQNVLHFCLEKRGKSKDAQIKKYYTRFLKYGTQYVSTYDFQLCHPHLHFRGKDENINGLQLADLVAYPIARKILSPEKPQLTFNIFEEKLYCGSNTRSYIGWGIKHFP